MSSDADTGVAANADSDDEADQLQSGSKRWADTRYDTFYTTSFGRDADAAFHDAVQQVRYATDTMSLGTIWEKEREDRGFVVIPDEEHENQDKGAYARQLIADGDDLVANIESPAGAINLSGTEPAREYREPHDKTGEQGALWLFFGLGTDPRSDGTLIGNRASTDQ
jgi:hypothetical protein